MKIQELRNLIRTEVRKAVNESQQIKEATAKPTDISDIANFLMANLETASTSKVKSMTRELAKEWKAVASNYTSLEEYLDELMETGGLEGFNESKQSRSTLKEAKKEVMTLTYNTDPDDLAYVKKILKASGIEVAVAAGTFDDEVLIIIEPGQEQKVKKALQKNGFDI
jgi:transcriptional/translational regulatory protein YebC/TACO1